MAEAADIPSLVQLAREAHEESRFGHIPFSAGKVERIARRALADTRRHGIMLGFRRGEPAGAVYCSVGEYHIGADVLLTTIHNLNVRRSVRARLSGGKITLGLMRGVRNQLFNCFIPDDHIATRRPSLFMARSVLRKQRKRATSVYL
jgi:hypothetical protein